MSVVNNRQSGTIYPGIVELTGNALMPECGIQAAVPELDEPFKTTSLQFSHVAWRKYPLLNGPATYNSRRVEEHMVFFVKLEPVEAFCEADAVAFGF